MYSERDSTDENGKSKFLFSLKLTSYRQNLGIRQGAPGCNLWPLFLAVSDTANKSFGLSSLFALQTFVSNIRPPLVLLTRLNKLSLSASLQRTSALGPLTILVALQFSVDKDSLCKVK